MKNESVKIDTIRDDVNGNLLLSSGTEVFTQQIPEGGFILASNNFDCDITYSEIVYVEENGEVKWHFSTYTAIFDLAEISALGLVEKDILAMVRNGPLPPIFLNLEGEEVIYTTPPDIYFNLSRLGEYWLASNNERLFKLDKDFKIVDWVYLDPVNFISSSEGSRILVGSDNSVFLLDTSFHEIASTDKYAHALSGDVSDHAIWIIKNDTLFELDTNLTLIKFYVTSNTESFVHVSGFGSTAYVATEYDGINNSDFVIRKYDENLVLPSDEFDVSLSSVKFPGRVSYEFWQNNMYVFIYTFDSIEFVVRNKSTDTISSFNINYDWDGTGWCTSTHHQWVFDDLVLPPGDSITVQIDTHRTNLVYLSLPLNICFWVDYPNKQPDINPEDNLACGTRTYAVPNEHVLIHPTYNDTYVSHQILPDGTIRIFWHSLHHSPELAYVDLRSEISLNELVPIKVEVPQSYNWNWPSDSHLSLNMIDGSTILMNRTYECDVSVTGAIVKLNIDGSIDWFVEFLDTLGSRAEKLLFYNASTIGVVMNDGTDLLIDTLGNYINYGNIDFPYQDVIQTKEGFIANVENKLYILDKEFAEVASFTLNGKVISITPQFDKCYIIRTFTSFYEIDSLNQITLLPIDNDEIQLLWKTENYYWGKLFFTNYVRRFNQNYTHVGDIYLPKGVNPLFVSFHEDAVFTASSYLNDISEGLLIYKNGEDNPNYRLRYDVEITNVLVPDSVFSYYLWTGIFNNGWYHEFEYVHVEVRNNSTDTLQTLYIQDRHAQYCFWCGFEYNIWKYDDLKFPPGESMIFDLGTYHPMCQYHEPGELCLHAFGPNDDADFNYLNDSYCQPYSLITGFSEPETGADILWPNPATDNITISSLHNYSSAIIFDSRGSLIRQYQIDDFTPNLRIEDLEPGIYLIKLSHENNRKIGYLRFIKI